MRIFVCEKCGAESAKWAGKCPACGEWNSLKELKLEEKTIPAKISKVLPTYKIDQIKDTVEVRLKTQISEFDQVLGGGFVIGSLVLLGGDPGIGKSTLVLQAATNIAQEKKVLYVSGEESLSQLKLRIQRLGLRASNLKLLSAIDIDQIIATTQKEKLDFLIIDSIQSIVSAEINSSAGSLIQVKLCALKLQNFAKINNLPVLMIGHVTKEGVIAGPKTLEHLVDTVLYLEGEKLRSFRILRSTKNRFGSVNEVGVFEMTDKGLMPAKNIANLFLGKQKEKIGSVVTCVMEGTRPFLVEIQSLVAKTYFGYPQRKSSGFDFNRLSLILATLANNLKLKIADKDVYLNVVGGLKIADPAADLAVAVAIVSAVLNRSVQRNIVVLGELGLLGEVRSITHLKRRVRECQSLGFKKIIIPKIFKDKNLTNKEKEIKIKEVENIREAVKKSLVP